MLRVVKIAVALCSLALLLSCGEEEEEEPALRRYAYIATEGFLQGIERLDVSDPREPYRLAHYYSSTVWDVCVEGDYIYTVDLTRLQIRSRTGPMEKVGTCRLSEQSHKVRVLDGYAYVAAGYDGFGIIDVSDPSAPYEVGFYEGQEASDVFVIGDYLYMVGSYSFAIVDVSHPKSPRQVGSCDISAGYGVYVSGDYAYVTTTNWLGDIFHVIDVSDPTKPRKVASYDFPGDYDGGEKVYVEGDYAYVITGGSNGFWVIDVSNPTNPHEIGACRVAEGAGVSVLDGYAYVGGSGFRIVDVSDLTKPQIIAAYGNNRVTGFYVVVD